MKNGTGLCVDAKPGAGCERKAGPAGLDYRSDVMTFRFDTVTSAVLVLDVFSM